MQGQDLRGERDLALALVVGSLSLQPPKGQEGMMQLHLSLGCICSTVYTPTTAFANR